MNIWIIGTIFLGIIVFISAIFFLITDSKRMLAIQKKNSYLFPNLTLILLSLSWILLAIYLFFMIQSQIAMFQS